MTITDVDGALFYIQKSLTCCYLKCKICRNFLSISIIIRYLTPYSFLCNWQERSWLSDSPAACKSVPHGSFLHCAGNGEPHCRYLQGRWPLPPIAASEITYLWISWHSTTWTLPTKSYVLWSRLGASHWLSGNFPPSPDNQAGKKHIITSHIGLIDYRQNFNALTIWDMTVMVARSAKSTGQQW